jgi:hypothetical protein
MFDVKEVDKEAEEPYEFKMSGPGSRLSGIRNPDKKMEERE